MRQFEGEPLYDWVRTILMQIEGGLFDGESSPVVSFQTNLDYTGLSHFSKLLQAILTKRVLKLRYTPYGKSQITATVYPYHLKEYNDRWYLIAQVKGFDSYAHYALDRIDDFEEVAVPYKEPDTDFSEYFDDVIGVTVPETDPENVLLRISNSRYNYIKTKPLHSSWDIIEEGDNYTTISITVKINKELESLILSFGDDIEVLEPVDFRKRIADKIKVMNEKYNKI